VIRQRLTSSGLTLLLALQGLPVLGQAAPTPSTPPPSLAPAPGASRHLEIKYVRDSGEYSTLTRQIYRLAGEAVAAAARSLPPDGWAVVLDVDETALDNSAYQLERAAYGLSFAQPSWQAWVRRAQAGAVPGVREFVQRVRQLGGRIAWITDREADEKGGDLTTATKVNLGNVGLWGERDLLCMRHGSKDSKAVRRRDLTTGGGSCSWPDKPVPVLVFVGDQLPDFPGNGESLPDSGSEDAFGHRFFLLPNPMYGGWTSDLTRRDIR
jgi:5'-nucleotidase (lipoprotein e(P4) family)